MDKFKEIKELLVRVLSKLDELEGSYHLLRMMLRP